MTIDRAKVGVLTIGRKRPGFDQEWNQIMRRECAGAGRDRSQRRRTRRAGCRRTNHAASPLDRLSNCTVLLVLQPSLGNGQLALCVAQNWKKATVLWATPERQEGEIVSSCSLVAQHLWASVLRQLNRPFEFVLGHPTENATRESITRAINVAHAHAQLKTARVGIVGTHAPGFLSMDVDPMLVQSQLGPQVHRFGLPQFFERAGDHRFRRAR